MQENRRVPRKEAKYQGKVILPAQPAIDCLIRDVSAFGARLQFRVRAFLPRSFQLRFEGGSHEVRVVWQSGLFAGVRFVKPLAMQVGQVPRKRSLWSALKRA